MKKMRERVTAYHNQSSQAEVKDRSGLYRGQVSADRIREAAAYRAEQKNEIQQQKHESPQQKNDIPQQKNVQQVPKPEVKKSEEQLNFFDEKLLSKEAKQEYTLVGQVLNWIVEYREQMYIIDQHAAHERVLYERTLRQMRDKQFTSQRISPPIVLNLSMQEEQLLTEHIDSFAQVGFEIEPFGGDSYAVRAVPDNLFGIARKDLLIEMLDSLSDSISTKIAPDIVLEKIASMSCKAAVKGNLQTFCQRSGCADRRTVGTGESISLSARETDDHRDDKNGSWRKSSKESYSSLFCAQHYSIGDGEGQMINFIISENFYSLFAGIGLMAAFLMTCVCITKFNYLLPKDAERYHAGKLSAGKPRGAGIIFILVFAAAALLFQSFLWRS